MSVDKSDQVRADPRLQQTTTKQRSRQSSTDNQKSEKLSIYEQGSIDRNATVETDIDIRGEYLLQINNLVIQKLKQKKTFFLIII